MKRNGRHRAAALAVVALLGAGTVHAQSKARDTADPLAARTKGAPDAPVTVYEMSDFQCPFCRRFALETFPAIDHDYISTGKVRWVFINFPLTSVHPNAAAAAELSLCAAEQGAFWPMHDLLYAHQESWAPLKEVEPFLLDLADSAKMKRAKTLSCLESPATRSAVQADAEGAARSGAQSTPAFYVEGGLLVGAHPITVFRQVLDSIYATKRLVSKPKPKVAPAKP